MYEQGDLLSMSTLDSFPDLHCCIWEMSPDFAFADKPPPSGPKTTVRFHKLGHVYVIQISDRLLYQNFFIISFTFEIHFCSLDIVQASKHRGSNWSTLKHSLYLLCYLQCNLYRSFDWYYGIDCGNIRQEKCSENMYYLNTWKDASWM